MSCKHCINENPQPILHEINESKFAEKKIYIDNGKLISIIMTIDKYTETYLDINNCPMCGADLRMKPLSEESISLIGKPVFVVIAEIERKWMLVRGWNSIEFQLVDSDGNRPRLLKKDLNIKWWAYEREPDDEKSDKLWEEK